MLHAGYTHIGPALVEKEHVRCENLFRLVREAAIAINSIATPRMLSWKLYIHNRRYPTCLERGENIVLRDNPRAKPLACDDVVVDPVSVETDDCRIFVSLPVLVFTPLSSTETAPQLITSPPLSRLYPILLGSDLHDAVLSLNSSFSSSTAKHNVLI
jgi:hypothetical protein